MRLIFFPKFLPLFAVKMARTLRNKIRTSYVISQGSGEKVIIERIQEGPQWLIMHIPGAGSERYATNFPGVSVSLQTREGKWIWNHRGETRVKAVPFLNVNDLHAHNLRYRLTLLLVKDKWFQGYVTFEACDGHGCSFLQCQGGATYDIWISSDLPASGNYSSWSESNPGKRTVIA